MISAFVCLLILIVIVLLGMAVNYLLGYLNLVALILALAAVMWLVNVAVIVVLSIGSGIFAGLLSAWRAKGELKTLADAAVAGCVAGLTSWIVFMAVLYVLYVLEVIVSLLISLLRSSGDLSLVGIQAMFSLISGLVYTGIIFGWALVGLVPCIFLAVLSGVIYASIVLKVK